MQYRLLAIASTGLLISACSSSPGANPKTHSDAGPEADAGNMNMGFDSTALATQYATAGCTNFFSCQPFVAMAGAVTMGDCVSKNTDGFKLSLDRIKAAVDAGRATFDATKFAACTAAVQNADCTLGLDPNACDFVTGTQAVGASCMSAFECIGDTFCNAMGTGVCGKCAATAAMGADCSTTPCAAGLACAQVQMNVFHCVPGAQAENAACGDANTGFCRGNLQCIANGMAGKCVRPATMGQMCEVPNGMTAATKPDCDFTVGLGCVNGTCAMSSLVSSGTCNDTSTVCSGENFCNIAMGATSGTCAPVPGAGMPCLNQSFCATDSHCENMANCAPDKPAMAACTATAECSGNLSCIGMTGAKTCQTFIWSKCM